MTEPVYEYRVTAYPNNADLRSGRNERRDVGGAGSPFRSDEPMWANFEEGELRGIEGLMQAIVEEVVALGYQDIHVERRAVAPWERIS